MPSILESLNSIGYAEIAETDPDLSSMDVATNIACAIGAAVSNVAERLTVSLEGIKPSNTYGGNYGLGELPLHTDLAHWYRPPRYVLLRCISGTQSVATQLVNHRQLEKWIPTSVMRRALFSPRRRLDGKMFLLRMLEDELFRWDQLFLKAQNLAARKATLLMQKFSTELPRTNVILSRPGQILLIDNWQVLHGRSAVHDTECDRKLDRLYLEISPNGNKNPA